ncbi:MAG: dTDP-4-dehydrorhamnose reductase [Vicinamibacterales bacterium]
MRVLVTGKQGLLGGAIVREFSSTAQVIALGHGELDVSDANAVATTLSETRPDLVINCAAYNDVDRAEDDPARALEVNAFGPLALARATVERDVSLIHFSTDFVFDGEKGSPYTEHDEPNPRGAYAASKLLGDWLALQAPRSWVLRVESLFGPRAPGDKRRSSLGTILDGIRRGDEVSVFTDRTVSPSYTADVAQVTRAVIERGAPCGLYHCVNSGAATWAEVAAEAARLMGLPLRMRPVTLETADLRAPRPRYCALSNAKLASIGIAMPTWQDALARYLGA